MKVWTPRSDTNAEAKLAAITHRNAGDAALAGAMPAIHALSVPAGSMKGCAFTASSGEGSKRTSPSAS